ncbi:hypothetical protein EB001_07725 [bacterium]|jgi:hypothetical protein|nr:hypothetical protein [bacterium]
MKTKTFTSTIEDKEVTLCVRSPSIEDQKEATKVYNQAFTDALKSKAVVRARLDDLLVEQGLWDNSKQKQFDDLQASILENERRLAKGGIPLSEAKDVALEMRKTRDKVRDLISVKTSLDTHTAEGQADNARFNYLVSACTVYDSTKQRYFSSLEDYLNRSTDIVALLAAQNLANMLYGLDNDYEGGLPENKFLKQYKFVDDKLRFLNKEGKLVDSEGRLIDENSRYIDADGNFIDKFGNRVDKDGEYIIESKPFLDDSGNPIILENKDKKEETKKDETVTTSTSETQSETTETK